jgi:IclR family pca regulon transcriptional regulator
LAENAESEKPDRYHLQTLARGAAVLDLLARRDYLTLKYVTDQLGLNSTVAYRLLRTWTSSGYLSYDASTRRYHAGLNLLRLATKTHGSSGLPEVEARLNRVSEEVGQTASFSVLAGRFVLYVARVVANKALMYQVEIGKTLPAYSTSAGHVLLAQQPLETLLELYPEPVLLGYTEQTVRSRDDLLRRLGTVREQGYAVNNGQLSENVTAVAVPVRNGRGDVVGAFSIAGPAAQFSTDDIYRRYLPVLLEAAREPLEVGLGAARNPVPQ